MVSIIIINYNTIKLTAQAVRSIIQYTKNTPYEIIVVDNDSPDDNPDTLLTEFPHIKLIKASENGGFARGNNIGIEQAKGDIVLLMNSDAYLVEDSISVMVNYLDEHPEIGSLGPELVYENGVYQKSARAFHSIRNELLNMVRPLLYLLPYRQRAKMMLNQYFKGDFSTVSDWLSGAFLMIRRDVVAQMPGGKLDERFFMYGEDQLWCLQIKELGYINYYLAETKVVHISNASTDAKKHKKLEQLTLKRELAIMKYRKGRSLYYYLFSAIYITKVNLRYWVTSLIQKLFNHRIR